MLDQAQEKNFTRLPRLGLASLGFPSLGYFGAQTRHYTTNAKLSFLGLFARLGLTCNGQTDDTLSRLCWTRLS